jgi:hypothetical protein
MNIEKIFEALKLDDKNSALEIICGELEIQGYTVLINGTPATSEKFSDGTFHDLEHIKEPLNITLRKNLQVEQKFAIKFVDFHEVIFQGSGE